MKLVSKGKPKPKTFRGTCFTCESTFDAEPAELKLEWDIGAQAYFARKECPVCLENGDIGALILYPKFAS
jgi:hypothetical protein